MKVIAKFFWDCGRSGEVSGLFVADYDELTSAFGKQVYLGEVLGKHSDVYGTLDQGDIAILSQDQEFITKFVEIVGDGTISGYNPLDYISDEE